MATLDFTKLPVDMRTTVWIGATGPSIGIGDVNEVSASELNNFPPTGMLPASQSISWNDWGFGVQASEVQNEPSLADAASYEEFGQSNYGGEISYYLPAEYDDDSNMHSLIYDLTDLPGIRNDIAVRIDGDVKTDEPAENGDFVSVYRVSGEGESNPFTPGEAKRRTVTYWNKSDFSHYTVIGDPELTAIPPAGAAWAEGDKGRIRVSREGRDVTNRMRFRTSNSNRIMVYAGGFYEVTGDSGTATVTITDPGTGASTTVQVS